MENKKIKIGVIGGHIEMIANEIASLGLTEKFEVIQVSEEEAKDNGIHMDTLIIDEPFIIQKRPEIEEPFYPKAKHSPKGHQRPYKFHR